MSSSQINNSRSVFIAQVECPQREDLGDYYYRTYAPGIAMAKEEGIYVVNLTNVHRKKEEVMRLRGIMLSRSVFSISMEKRE